MGLDEDVSDIIGGKYVPLDDRGKIGDSQEVIFLPKTKVNMCYIVGAVLFDEENRVLMIQEAKKSCRGTWYLPLGRLEQGENFMEGAKREVKEESGMECDLDTLLSVEYKDATWMRLTFTGRLTGGKLKTEAQADAESIQAKFFSEKDISLSRSSLRSGDVLKLIQAAKKYRERQASGSAWKILPVVHNHKHLTHRIIIIDRSIKGKYPISVLVKKANGPHIPHCFVDHTKETAVGVSVYALLNGACGRCSEVASVRMCGVLGIEHNGKENVDGVVFTSLVSLDLSDSASSPAILSNEFTWFCSISEDVQHALSQAAKGKIVPLL